VTSGVLEHHLFLFPLCDPLLILLFSLRLGFYLSSSFALLLGALFNGACQGFITNLPDLFNGACQGFITNLPDFFSHPTVTH